MMTKLQFGVVSGLLAVIAVLQAAPILMPNQMAPKFEYRIEGISDANFESEMDKHGEGGWELVFARRATEGGGKGALYEVIFKRPK
jgi:hypothetical protein